MADVLAVKRNPPMVVTVIEGVGGFRVDVEHADHQSWSRSVQPRATRAARLHVVRQGRGAVAGDRKFSAEDSEVIEGLGPHRSLSRFWYQYR